MKSFFKELFDYNHHFNQKLSAAYLENAHLTSEKSVQLFSHILNAHHIWLSRINGKVNQYSVWEMHSIEIMKAIDQENYKETTTALDRVDLGKLTQYQNSKGQIFENKIGDIFYHIINHSTYHRGQIASDFRQNDIEPLNTDYIFYKR